MNEKTRAYIYRILLAIGGLAVGYGILTGEEIALWLGVAMAALNIMPSSYTSTKDYMKDTEHLEPIDLDWDRQPTKYPITQTAKTVDKQDM